VDDHVNVDVDAHVLVDVIGFFLTARVCHENASAPGARMKRLICCTSLTFRILRRARN
jgi:hypothetical protein